MKKVSRTDVLAKFAEALSVCPPELLADLEDAMATYAAGDSVTAGAHLDRTDAKARKRSASKS